MNMNMNNTSTRRLTCLIMLVFCSSQTNAQDDFYYPADPDWRFRLNFGFGLWESQEDLSAVGPGEFDAGPIVIEIGVDRRVAKWGRSDVYIGLDAGLLTTESDLPGQYTSPTSDASYVTPSIAVYIGDFDATRFNVRAGVGHYRVEFGEIIDLTTFNRSFSESAFGSFVGAGIDFPLGAGNGLHSITLATRVHFVDFGDVTQLGPTPGRLEGPIWNVQLGWGWRF